MIKQSVFSYFVFLFSHKFPKNMRQNNLKIFKQKKLYQSENYLPYLEMKTRKFQNLKNTNNYC